MRPGPASRAGARDAVVSGPPLPSGPVRVLRTPAYRFLLGSALASALGGSITSVSVNWLVYHYTHSTIDIAYVGLTGIVPGIALGLFAGVLADRYNRRRLMVTADLSRLVAMAILAAALAFLGFSLLLVLGVMAVVYSFSAIFTPASQAILPRLVGTAELEDANGLLSATTQAGLSVGGAAGGLVVVSLGAVVGLGMNAATYAISAVLLFQIAVSAGGVPPATAAARSFSRELREGLRYMREHVAILEASLGFLPANFLLTMVISFLVVYASTYFGSDAAVYGYLVAALAAGVGVGALAVGRLRARRYAGLLMVASVVGEAGAVALLIVGRALPVALLGAAMVGLTIGLINTVYFATIQAIVPNAILARVLSIDSVGAFVAIPAGLVVGGVLAADYGIEVTYVIDAIGLLGCGLVLFAMRGVRTLGYGA